MPVIKVIEILTESTKSWEDAAQTAVDEASKSIKNIRSVFIKEFSTRVDNNKITHYRINAKISFEVLAEH